MYFSRLLKKIKWWYEKRLGLKINEEKGKSFQKRPGSKPNLSRANCRLGGCVPCRGGGGGGRQLLLLPRLSLQLDLTTPSRCACVEEAVLRGREPFPLGGHISGLAAAGEALARSQDT